MSSNVASQANLINPLKAAPSGTETDELWSYVRPLLLSPDPNVVGDSALIAVHQNGCCVGFVADAPRLPPDLPQDTTSVILQAFTEAIPQIWDRFDPQDSKAIAKWIFDFVNESISQRHPAHQACFLAFYRFRDSIAVSAVGDVSAVLAWPGKLIRVSNPEPNEIYGKRSLELHSPVPAISERTARIGQMPGYPEDAVLQFPSAGLQRIVLFSDGVEKHDPDFESRLIAPYAGQEDFRRVLQLEGRLPKRAGELKDDICVLLFDFPPMEVPATDEEPEVTLPEADVVELEESPPQPPEAEHEQKEVVATEGGNVSAAVDANVLLQTLDKRLRKMARRQAFLWIAIFLLILWNFLLTWLASSGIFWR